MYHIWRRYRLYSVWIAFMFWMFFASMSLNVVWCKTEQRCESIIKERTGLVFTISRVVMYGLYFCFVAMDVVIVLSNGY